MMSFLQIPPTDKPTAFANVSKGNGWDHLQHCSAKGQIQHCAGRFLQCLVFGTAAGRAGQVLPQLTPFQPLPQNPKAQLLAKHIPNHGPCPSSPIYAQEAGGTGSRLIQLQVGLTPIFEAFQGGKMKVLWPWHASPSAPPRAFIQHRSTRTLKRANSFCKAALSLLAGALEGSEGSEGNLCCHNQSHCN